MNDFGEGFGRGLGYIILGVLCGLLSYLITGFITYEWTAAGWTEGQRAGAVVLGFLFYAGAIIAQRRA